MALNVSRILHAGYLFECEGTRVLCDPLFENPFSRNCFAFPSVDFDHEAIRREIFDAVLISHYHDDHFSFESLDFIDRSTPIYLFCVHEEMFSLLREFGFRSVHALALKRPVRLGAITVTAHPALDLDVDSILEIEAGGLRVLNVVDAWIDPDVFSSLKMKSWDLVLWPFQTMRELEVLSPGESLRARPEIPHEWLEQLSELRARTIVPSSCQFRFEEWSWLNHAFFPVSYEMFERAVLRVAPRARVLRMNPGTSWQIKPDSIVEQTRLSWVQPIGDQNLDYVFDAFVVPSATGDVAKKFERLEPRALSRLDRFFKKELSERFAQLESQGLSWFDQPRVWSLSVYDHEGSATVFCYRVEGSAMQAIDSNANADWRTEIIGRKLLGALDEGESLSSLYLRINGHSAGDTIDDRTRDPLEDPLLRVLFSGQIGSYQRAQLRRMQGRT